MRELPGRREIEEGGGFGPSEEEPRHEREHPLFHQEERHVDPGRRRLTPARKAVLFLDAVVSGLVILYASTPMDDMARANTPALLVILGAFGVGVGGLVWQWRLRGGIGRWWWQRVSVVLVLTFLALTIGSAAAYSGWTYWILHPAQAKLYAQVAVIGALGLGFLGAIIFGLDSDEKD